VSSNKNPLKLSLEVYVTLDHERLEVSHAVIMFALKFPMSRQGKARPGLSTRQGKVGNTRQARQGKGRLAMQGWVGKAMQGWQGKGRAARQGLQGKRWGTREGQQGKRRTARQGKGNKARRGRTGKVRASRQGKCGKASRRLVVIAFLVGKDHFDLLLVGGIGYQQHEDMQHNCIGKHLSAVVGPSDLDSDTSRLYLSKWEWEEPPADGEKPRTLIIPDKQLDWAFPKNMTGNSVFVAHSKPWELTEMAEMLNVEMPEFNKRNEEQTVDYVKDWAEVRECFPKGDTTLKLQCDLVHALAQHSFVFCSGELFSNCLPSKMGRPTTSKIKRAAVEGCRCSVSRL
jgi:hypothetical protein